MVYVFVLKMVYDNSDSQTVFVYFDGLNSGKLIFLGYQVINMPETALKPHFSNYNSREQFPSFEKPHIIDGFSLGQDRSIAGSSRRNLKYLRLPDSPFDFDLNVGYESYVPGPKEVNITSLLQCIHHKKEVFLSSGKLSADFVCYRGLLTQILTSPYFSRDPWSIIATRYKGTIYLCSYTSPERTKRMQERETEYSNRCCYYGKNFERFIFTGKSFCYSISQLPTN